MKKIKNSLIFLLLSANIVNLFAANLTSLLKEYKKESALWKKTKKESSGILYLYTREDLEKMQVKNLRDILKTVPGINLCETINNLPFISISSNKIFPDSGVRIFINGHDMSSASFGSAFLLWGDLNIEYIDHIEIYKETSSVEFGNETAPIVIKLYTKRADREEGGKFRAMMDQKGSAITNVYVAKELNDDFSYCVYGNLENFNNKRYKKEFNNKSYILGRDHKDYNFYSNFIYKKWFFEIGAIDKNLDGFLGFGIHHTPLANSSSLNANQQYIHVTRKYENGLKLQLSIDNILYSQNLNDLNGILVRGLMRPGEMPIGGYIKFHDNIYYFSLKKTIITQRNRLFVGGFNKYKTIKEKNLITMPHKHIGNSYSNSLNYSSLYVKEEFKAINKLSLIGELKEDLYSYDKELSNYSEDVSKVGIKYKDKKLFLQFFYTHSYIPVAFYEYYEPDNFPYSANKKLKTPTIDIYTIISKYKFSDGYLKISLAKNHINKSIVYNPMIGFVNADKKAKYNSLELSYYKELNENNNFELDFYDSYNYSNKLFSPKWGANFRLFNTFDKFDIYNELVFKSSFNSPYNIKIKRSYDWTASVKYHVNKDFSIGIRGENILNKGLKQAYSGLSYAVPVAEQKFWLNVEYLF